MFSSLKQALYLFFFSGVWIDNEPSHKPFEQSEISVYLMRYHLNNKGLKTFDPLLVNNKNVSVPLHPLSE